MARENRRNFALDRLQFVARMGAGEIEKYARHSVEPAPASLERLDRIGEARRRRIGGDDVDLRSRLAERGLEGRPEMARLERSNGGASNGPVQGSSSGFGSFGERVMGVGLMPLS